MLRDDFKLLMNDFRPLIEVYDDFDYCKSKKRAYIPKSLVTDIDSFDKTLPVTYDKKGNATEAITIYCINISFFYRTVTLKYKNIDKRDQVLGSLHRELVYMTIV